MSLAEEPSLRGDFTADQRGPFSHSWDQQGGRALCFGLTRPPPDLPALIHSFTHLTDVYSPPPGLGWGCSDKQKNTKQNKTGCPLGLSAQ